MKNFVTGYEYSGKNAEILMSLGYDETDSFVTFKQAIRSMGIAGKKLKGLKKAATLVRYSKEKDPETGKEEMKPTYFSVFDATEVLKRK